MAFGSQFLFPVTVASVVLTMMAQLSPTPAYNVVLSFFGLYAQFSGNPRALGMFLIALGFSIIMDITWCGIYGPGISALENGFIVTEEGSTANFGMAMLIINMFAKAIQAPMVYGMLGAHGGLGAVTRATPAPGAGAGAYAAPASTAPSTLPEPVPSSYASYQGADA